MPAGAREADAQLRVVVRRRLRRARRVERSRAVHRVLARELDGGVHALALELSGTA